MSWDKERDAILIEMWNGGKSAREIAPFVEKSREAVCGRIHRLREKGMQLRTFQPPAKTSAPKSGKRRRKTWNRLPNGVARIPSKATIAERVERIDTGPEWQPVPQSSPVKLEDLEPHHCRWPLGDPKSAGFRFCGADAHDGSYCPVHTQMSGQWWTVGDECEVAA